MPQVSVIIPVYNVEAYVEQCLQSMLDQSFSDWEAIVVNDGSTDRSADILERFARQDSRFKVITQENRGLGGARNTGLDQAQGKYILFLDSDDFLVQNGLEICYRAAEQDQLDIAIADFYEYQNASGQVRPVPKALRLACKTAVDADKGDSPDEFAKMAFALPFACGKLIRRELIEKNHLRFMKGAVEDVPFTVFLAVQCKRIKILEGKYLFYYRTSRPGSISHQGAKMVLDGVMQFASLENNLKKIKVFEQAKETFWFNKMVLLIGDEKLFAGRLGNVPPEVVQQVYNAIRPDMEALDPALFAKRNGWFRWKVKAFRQAVLTNDLEFPRRIRRIRNVVMVFLDPWYKAVYWLKKQFKKD